MDKNKPNKTTDIINRLKAKYGIFMIMGNHDGFKRANLVLEKSLQDSNIILLQNKNTVKQSFFASQYLFTTFKLCISIQVMMYIQI